MMQYLYPVFFLIFTLSSCNFTSKDTQGNSLDSLSTTDNTDTIKLISENYDRIQAIQQWDRIDSAELIGMSTEGGIAKYFFKNNQLEKITATHYGEGGKNENFFYLLDNELSFVFQKSTSYNAPVNSKEFDVTKSQTLEFRYYYDHENCIKAINPDSNVVTFNEDETQSIATNFQLEFSNLIKIKNNGYKMPELEREAP